MPEGILVSSKDDFEDGDEVYEAIGQVLHEVAAKPETEVRSVKISSGTLILVVIFIEGKRYKFNICPAFFPTPRRVSCQFP